jgi:hypothetical protein
MHKTGKRVRPHPNSATARPHGPVLETRVPSPRTTAQRSLRHGKSSQGMIRSFGKQRHRARPWIALAAAYMLVLQVVMSGLAAGTAAGSVWSAIPSICSSGGREHSRWLGAAARSLASSALLHSGLQHVRPEQCIAAGCTLVAGTPDLRARCHQPVRARPYRPPTRANASQSSRSSTDRLTAAPRI